MAYNIERYPLHLALGGDDQGGGLEQNAFELRMLCDFIKLHEIKSYLEIGIAKGWLMKFMRDEMQLTVKGITLDKYPEHEGLPVTYVSSQDIEWFGQKHDLIFVDGNHSYEGVKSDYNKFYRNCKFMAFHDICGHRNCGGVNKLWEEIKNKHEDYWEFIAPNKEYQSGIGIICG